ncbi:MAG: glycosyltransferase family 4 protein [Cyclobacteriaceae bacterium]|nr:glycosyltransferase family 4 protein [Cyclobacteriaceae bacterium]
MQIVHIVPGSGGSFYCGNCLRDSKYMYGLKEAGVEVVKVPMYLPIFADEHDLEQVPVFYGAVSLYLRHSFKIMRKAPRWLDKIFNSAPALKLAAGMAGSTNPRGLEDMTISMLLGEAGGQNAELDHLVDWLKNHCHADVIHISNALLLGLARKLKNELGVKIVCSLQDEDVWVNAMDEPFRTLTWELMKERAKDVDAFFSVSEYFAGKMKKWLDIPDQKLITNHISIDPDDYRFTDIDKKPLNIGYISRLCESNGLGVLVDAFIILKKNPAWEKVNLVITGGYTGADEAFIKSMKKKITKAGLQDAVEFHVDFEAGRHDFFRKVVLVSVPVLEGEAFGLYLLESMASGVPVVQPALGAFPEIIQKSGGGVVYKSNTPALLAEAWANVLADKAALKRLSVAARSGVESHFNIHKKSSELVKLYSSIVQNQI